MASTNSTPRPIENPRQDLKEPEFSHPSEQEFARVLDFYGIEWRYEPTTFPLRWDDDGKVLEAFSPDFYFVDADLYIELTTLRPKLMRFKHRKLRRMRKLYPNVQVKLWNRKDFERFLEHLGLQDRRRSLIGKEALEEERAST